MPTYRLYRMACDRNTIESYSEFDSASDIAAIARAEDLAGRGRMELWTGGQRVLRFAAPAMARQRSMAG